MFSIYETNRLLLMTPTKKYLDEIIDYYSRNSNFLEEWEPDRSPDFLTKKYQKWWIKAEQNQLRALNGICFLIIKKTDSKRIIGMIRLSNIVYGNFCSCSVGYRLDKDEQCHGYMTEALRKVTSIAFCELGLRRIEASIIPHNTASRRVLEKNMFKQIGHSDSYLKINKEWRAHDLFEKIADSEE